MDAALPDQPLNPIANPVANPVVHPVVHPVANPRGAGCGDMHMR
jgi:hypothetical protein